MTSRPTAFEPHESGALLHGTKTDLVVGDLLVPGRPSNFGGGRIANHGSTLWNRSVPWTTTPT